MKIKLDLTGFQKFYAIFNDLSQGNNITKEMWDDLFKTPGYRSLIKKEFKKDFFIRNFELAFNPEKEEELQESLEDSKISNFLQYYVLVKSNIEEYKEAIDNIKDNWTSIEDSIFTRASSLLPLREWESEPMVSLVVFDRDARAYDTIAVDPIFSTNMEAFVSIVGHELHHILRDEILAYNPEKIEEEDSDLIWVLNQIHSEGVADHIDKGFFIYSRFSTFYHDEYVELFKEEVQNSPTVIQKMNQIFENSDIKKIGKELKELIPLSGHSLGYYAVNIIIKNLQIDTLLNDVGSPFHFFKLFNEAVEKDRKEIPPFSEDTIKIIEKLEKKYVK